jgi:hypothetical protein
MQTNSSSSLRRLVLFGTPILMAIVSVIHPIPHGESFIESIEPHLGTWLAVHIVQLVLIGLLGITMGLLVSGLSGTAAMVSRVAVVFFLVFYGAFDGIVGLGTGVLVWLRQMLSASDQAAAAQLVEAFWDARLDPASLIPVVILTGGLSWLVAATAAGLALRRAGVPRLAPWLLFLAGLFFGIDHPFPTGTLGMICLLVAVILLERQSVAETESSARPMSEVKT